MRASDAVQAFTALAQDTRLAVFRLLVEAGPSGIAAGEVARQLGVPHNTMSTHLAVLARAGLIASRRESRSVIYAADMSGVRALLDFLLSDCCKGRPEICAPLLDAAIPSTTAPACCGTGDAR